MSDEELRTRFSLLFWCGLLWFVMLGLMILFK